MDASGFVASVKEEIENISFCPIKVEPADCTIKSENLEDYNSNFYYPVKNEEKIDIKNDFPPKEIAIDLKQAVKTEDFTAPSEAANAARAEEATTKDLFGRCAKCKLSKRCQCNAPNRNKNAKRYHCSKCAYSTLSKSSLPFHYKRRHDAEWKSKMILYCFHCDYTSSFKNSLADHIKRNHWQNYGTFACPKCHYRTKLKEYLAKHIQRQHDMLDSKSLFKCTQCTYVSKYNHHLMQHIEVKHNNSEPYKCDICGHKTKCKQYLQKHMKRIHSEPTKCTYCTYIASSQEHLREHQKSRHKDVPEVNKIPRCITYKCKFNCGFLIDNTAELHIHYQKVHQDEISFKYIKNVHQGKNLSKYSKTVHQVKNALKYVKMLDCSKCDFSTRYPHDLKLHFRAQHDESFKGFKCHFCTYSSKQKNILLKHIRTKHGEEKMPSKQNVTFYSCMHCNFYTRYKDVIAHHFRKSRKLCFVCDTCQLKTGCKSHLDFHKANFKHDTNNNRKKTINNNRRKKNISCLHCGYKTSSKPSLVLHLRCTSRARNKVKCNFCSLYTKCRAFLNHHIDNKHVKSEDIVQEENYTCQEIIKTENDLRTESVLISRNENYILDIIKKEEFDIDVES